MRIRPGIFIVLAVAFLVLFGGRQLGWFGGKPGELTSTGESQTAPDAPSAGTADQPQTVHRPASNPAKSGQRNSSRRQSRCHKFRQPRPRR